MSFKEFARLPLGLTLPVNDVNKREREEVQVKCQFACSLMSLLLVAGIEKTSRKEQQAQQRKMPLIVLITTKTCKHYLKIKNYLNFNFVMVCKALLRCTQQHMSLQCDTVSSPGMTLVYRWDFILFYCMHLTAGLQHYT